MAKGKTLAETVGTATAVDSQGTETPATNGATEKKGGKRKKNDQSNRPFYQIVAVNRESGSEQVMSRQKTLHRALSAFGEVITNWGNLYKDFSLLRIKVIPLSFSKDGSVQVSNA